MTKYSDNSSAVSSSIINVNVGPRGKSRRRQGNISRSASSADIEELDNIYRDIDNLRTNYLNSAITDPNVAPLVQSVRSAVLFLDDTKKQAVADYVKSTVCNTRTAPASPTNTVYNFLCGCSGNLYGGLKASCTASCALSPFNDDSCGAKVVYFGTGTDGNFKSSVLSEANSTSCNIFVDNNVSITTDQLRQALLQANCQSSTFYNSNTNAPLTQSDFLQMQPAGQYVPATANVPTDSAGEATGTTTTTSKVSIAYGPGNGTIPTVDSQTVGSFSAGGVSLWITFGIVLFILLVLVVAIAIWRYSAYSTTC